MRDASIICFIIIYCRRVFKTIRNAYRSQSRSIYYDIVQYIYVRMSHYYFIIVLSRTAVNMTSNDERPKEALADAIQNDLFKSLHSLSQKVITIFNFFFLFKIF